MRETMTFQGHDDLFRPVYEDSCGRVWFDTDPRPHVPASLYSVVELPGGTKKEVPFFGKAKFVPKRVTW